MVEFEKLYVVATNGKATFSTVFPGKIFRQATRTAARNYTVSETGEMLMYVLRSDNCTCYPSRTKYQPPSFSLSCVYFIERAVSLS